MQITNPNFHILGLDLGDKRVGVASANIDALIASPLATLLNDENLIPNLQKLIDSLNVQVIVVGLPRNLDGKDSKQTKKIRKTTKDLEKALGIKTVSQDEALSSVRAEDELKTRGNNYTKEEVDKLAACFILEDYIRDI